jgi:flagellar hook-length control protein FliK
MNPESISHLRLLVDTAPPASLYDSKERPLAPLLSGQALDARVEGQTPRGRLVNVRGHYFEFVLPRDVREGDILRLVYLDDKPRPTFALTRIDRDPLGPGSRLSEAGRLLSALIEGAGETAATPAQGPVFAGQPPRSAEAAPMLQAALGLSGLFYESHLAQWQTGTRSLAQIRAEPQGKLPPIETGGTASAESDSTTEEALSLTHVASDSSEPAAGSPSPARAESFPIIRNQLSALETGQLLWQGQVWQGQSMEWTIDDATQGDCEHGAHKWHTHIKITLPSLGEVHVSVDLAAQTLDLRIVADTAGHVALLRRHLPALVTSLSNSNLTLASLLVDHEPKAS